MRSNIFQFAFIFLQIQIFDKIPIQRINTKNFAS